MRFNLAQSIKVMLRGHSLLLTKEHCVLRLGCLLLLRARLGWIRIFNFNFICRNIYICISIFCLILSILSIISILSILCILFFLLFFFNDVDRLLLYHVSGYISNIIFYIFIEILFIFFLLFLFFFIILTE